MKGIKISEKYVINMYKFMEMCGLTCKVKKNVLLSHNAMMRKLKLRHNLFPSEVIMPKSISIYDVTKEDIYRGTIVIVRDDYKKKLAYINPKLFHKQTFILTEEEREKLREKSINEYLMEKEQEEEYKPGYIKYLNKKANKEIEEEQAFVEKEIIESNIEEDYYDSLIEKKVRIVKYKRRGFGRR